MLAPWLAGVRETPVTATRLCARNSRAASLTFIVLPPRSTLTDGRRRGCGGSSDAQSAHAQPHHHPGTEDRRRARVFVRVFPGHSSLRAWAHGTGPGIESVEAHFRPEENSPFPVTRRENRSTYWLR